MAHGAKTSPRCSRFRSRRPTKTRSELGLWLGEVVATFGLLLVIFGVVRSQRTSAAPFAVAGYIGAAYWFIASRSFAKPAATLARTLTNTCVGIARRLCATFLAAKLVGAILAVLTITELYPRIRQAAPNVVLPHDATGTDRSDSQPTPSWATLP